MVTIKESDISIDNYYLTGYRKGEIKMRKIKAKVSTNATVEMIAFLKKYDDGHVELEEILDILDIDDIEDIEVISEFE